MCRRGPGNIYHFGYDRRAAHKIVDRCTLPLTGARIVHRIINELAVIDVTARGLRPGEWAEDTTVQAVQAAAGARLIAV